MTDADDRARRVLMWILAWVLVAVAAFVAVQNWFLVNASATIHQWDLEVYRRALRSWTDGGELYDFVLNFPGRPEGYPFTYPPFAAVLLKPIAWIPDAIVDNAWTFGTLALVAAMSVFVVWRAPRTSATWLGPAPERHRLVTFAALAALALLLSLPVAHTLVLGQVSLAITAMALFDAGGLVPSRYRGVLIGLAAAIKLTPLIFIPYFLVTRQWRAAIIASSTFLAATAIAFVVAPHESIVYWGDKLFETSRVGDLATIQNKSVLGLLARWDLGGAGQTLIWVLLGLAIVAIALWQASRQFHEGRLVAAAIIIGCASVAVSPISWPHHQAWAVLAGVWLLLQRRALFMVLGAGLVAINLVVSPLMGQEIMPQGNEGPLWLRLGRELPTIAFVLICLFGLPTGRSRRSAPADPQAALAAG